MQFGRKNKRTTISNDTLIISDDLKMLVLLRYFWNCGIKVNCSLTSTLNYCWMFRKVVFIAFSIP